MQERLALVPAPVRCTNQLATVRTLQCSPRLELRVRTPLPTMSIRVQVSEEFLLAFVRDRAVRARMVPVVVWGRHAPLFVYIAPHDTS